MHKVDKKRFMRSLEDESKRVLLTGGLNSDIQPEKLKEDAMYLLNEEYENQWFKR